MRGMSLCEGGFFCTVAFKRAFCKQTGVVSLKEVSLYKGAHLAQDFSQRVSINDYLYKGASLAQDFSLLASRAQDFFLFKRVSMYDSLYKEASLAQDSSLIKQ
eukprot:1233706-Amphidinium_carterae.1